MKKNVQSECLGYTKVGKKRRKIHVSNEKAKKIYENEERKEKQLTKCISK